MANASGKTLEEDITASFFPPAKPWVSEAFDTPPPPHSQLTMVPCNIQHQYKATVTLHSHSGAKLGCWEPTHLEGVEEVPEGPGIYHIVVHGEEEGDDNTGNSCGHGGKHLVSRKPQNAQGSITSVGCGSSTTMADTGEALSLHSHVHRACPCHSSHSLVLPPGLSRTGFDTLGPGE